MTTPASVVYTAPLLRMFPVFSRSPPDLARTPPDLTDFVEVRQVRAYLRLMNKQQEWTGPVQFRIDTGADITQLSLEMALSEEWNLDIGSDCGYVRRTTAKGEDWVRVYRGSIGVRFTYPAKKKAPPDFVWKCLFIEGLPPETPPLLGLHDVLESVRIRFDKTALPSAPYGAAIFERYETLT